MQTHSGVVFVATVSSYRRADALAYWADFPDEIDDLISRHSASQDQALASWERRRALDDI
jgi:hypothetical protein